MNFDRKLFMERSILMVARMVFQMTMMVVVVALAVHMVVQRNHAPAQQVVAATKIAQPAPQVPSMAAVQPHPIAAVVAQVEPATKVSTKDDVPSGKTAVGPNVPGTLEVANLPGSGEVVR